MSAPELWEWDGKRYSDALAATLRGLGWRFDTNSAQWTVPL